MILMGLCGLLGRVIVILYFDKVVLYCKLIRYRSEVQRYVVSPDIPLVRVLVIYIVKVGVLFNLMVNRIHPTLYSLESFALN